MSEKAWIAGSTEEVVKRILEYVEAGMNFVIPVDLLAMMADASEAPVSVGRTIEVCRALKEATSN